jgi:3-oxoacyl-[acyl-carrier protein] reductase
MQSVESKFATQEIIAVYGCGILFRQCFKQIMLIVGRVPDLIIDQNVKLHGEKICGVPCVDLDSVREFGTNITVYIAVKKYEAIANDLTKRGFRKIYIFDYDKVEFAISNVRRYEKGYSDYKALQSQTRISDDWILITGAAGGLGAALAITLAKMGCKLILHGRTLKSLNFVVGQCSPYAENLHCIAADLRESSEILKQLQSLENENKHVEILINNAAVSPYVEQKNIFDISIDAFSECYKINVIAPIIFISKLLPKMLARNKGILVNISSSIQYKLEASHYATSKAALNKYIFDIAPALQGTNVSATLVDPGWIRTPMTNFDAPNPVNSAINGVLISCMLNLNGKWISAQDFSGQTLSEALKKARQIFPDNEF